MPVLPLDVVDHQTDKLDANLTQVDAASVYTLPAGADFLMCYSVAEGGGVFNTNAIGFLGLSSCKVHLGLIEGRAFYWDT